MDRLKIFINPKSLLVLFESSTWSGNRNSIEKQWVSRFLQLVKTRFNKTESKPNPEKSNNKTLETRVFDEEDCFQTLLTHMKGK